MKVERGPKPARPDVIIIMTRSEAVALESGIYNVIANFEDVIVREDMQS